MVEMRLCYSVDVMGSLGEFAPDVLSVFISKDQFHSVRCVKCIQEDVCVTHVSSDSISPIGFLKGQF